MSSGLAQKQHTRLHATQDLVVQYETAREFSMLFMGIMLLALWITGMLTSYTMGGFIHVLLILAIVAMMSRMIRSNTSTKLAEWRAAAPQPGALGTDK
jgi:predicted membrane protein